MINDPIVNEVRKIRDELAKKFDYDIYDIDVIFLNLREKKSRFHNRKTILRKSRKIKQIHDFQCLDKL